MLSLASSARRGAPVVRNSAGAGFSVTPPNKNPEEFREGEGCGPSWIRTRDQSVMSRGGGGWQGVAGAVTGSQPVERTGVSQGQDATPVGTVSTVSTPRGAPVVRSVVRALVRPAPPAMLTVREVAGELAVCRATVYTLLERGELERVWVGRPFCN